MADEEGPTSRARVLASGMRLFGENGYTGTRIAQIEEAAGLSPGSGALYRHFPSKRAILDAGVDAALTSGRALTGLIDDPATLAALPLEDRLFRVAKAGLATLREEGDLNRLLLRDLAQFDDLLERTRDEQIGRFFRAFAAWLRAQPEAAAVAASVDWDAVAMVLMGAVTHFWIMVDTFGVHPLGLDEDRYLRAAARLGAALLDREVAPDRVSPVGGVNDEAGSVGVDLRFEIFPADLDDTVSFYVDVLRFALVRDERLADPPSVALQRGTVRVGAARRPEAADLAARRPPVGVELVLEVDDVDADRERVRQAGWPVEEDLQDRPWGLRDFRLLDPSGYYLRITQA